jgi:hypothetical protein
VVARHPRRHIPEVRLDDGLAFDPAVAFVEPASSGVRGEHREHRLVVRRREDFVGLVHEQLAGTAPPPRGMNVQHANGGNRRVAAKIADVDDPDDPSRIPRHERAVRARGEARTSHACSAPEPVPVGWRDGAVSSLRRGRMGAGNLVGVGARRLDHLERAAAGTDPRVLVTAPGGDRLHRGGALRAEPARRRRRDGFVPAGRDQVRGEIRQWGEDEEAVPHLRVGHLEQSRGRGGIDERAQRLSLMGTLDGNPGGAEQQEVEIQLAGTPALAALAARIALDALERDEQLRRAVLGCRPAGGVDGDHGVEEVRLVHYADRRRPVQPRDASNLHAPLPGELGHRVRQGQPCIAHVRAEPDVRPDLRQVDLRSVCESAPVGRAVVRILHPQPPEDAGELTRLLARARSIVADDLAERFRAAGADDARIEGGPSDGRSFGARLRSVAAELPAGTGLVVLGAGSIVLAADGDLRSLVATAASGDRRGLTNNRYSSDVIAVGDASVLAAVPELRGDNALPRVLAEAGIPVEELPDRDRLGVDLDSPLDLELLRRHPDCPASLSELARSLGDRLSRVPEVLDELGTLATDPHRELLVAGRLSAATLRRLEERAACRVRALIEERGLRTALPRQRPAASVLGLLLDRNGPEAIGALVARLADGAVVDSRVLLAHRIGADETRWPTAEDRFASDLLLAERVRDPWLHQLTLHASSHELPIALGAHSLVGPGLGLALGLDQ